MSETGWTAGTVLALGALAVVSSLSPEADRAVTISMLVLLGLGVVAGMDAYRTHVLRIRREIEVRGTVLRRVEPPPVSRPVRRLVRGPADPPVTVAPRRGRRRPGRPVNRRNRRRPPAHN